MSLELNQLLKNHLTPSRKVAKQLSRKAFDIEILCELCALAPLRGINKIKNQS